ncbi:phosphoribosylformylglycinamidine synthase subunit PurQ [soil metagenome]
MSAQVGVVVFPGSNCERDAAEALGERGAAIEMLWHADASVKGCDAVVVPGGFAHGDYLRPGAIARFSPVMAAVTDFARAGGPVLGICNGFQILTEAGLLPGALQKNSRLKFLCTTVDVRVESANSMLTAETSSGEILRLPINHFEGNYTCDAATLEELRTDDRVLLRYVDNPNGSIDDIAGICSNARNVVGLMPHPERACDLLLGSDDGSLLLKSFLAAAGRRQLPERGIPALVSTEEGTPS